MALTEDPASVVLGLKHGLMRFSPVTGELVLLAEIPHASPGMRTMTGVVTGMGIWYSAQWPSSSRGHWAFLVVRCQHGTAPACVAAPGDTEQHMLQSKWAKPVFHRFDR